MGMKKRFILSLFYNKVKLRREKRFLAAKPWFSTLVRDTVRDGGVTFLLLTGIALFDDDLSSFTAWRILADGISPVLAGDETICKPLFGEVAEVYRNGVNRLANQPTKRFHPERFLYSSLVNRVLSSLSCSNMVFSSCVVSLSKMKALTS